MQSWIPHDSPEQIAKARKHGDALHRLKVALREEELGLGSITEWSSTVIQDEIVLEYGHELHVVGDFIHRIAGVRVMTADEVVIIRDVEIDFPVFELPKMKAPEPPRISRKASAKARGRW